MYIGLFFGSFNPIHTGHLIIGSSLLNQTALQKIWFVVSPHNPLKEKESLLPQQDRLHLVRLAIEHNPKFAASNIEFKLPQPSYTIDTLTVIREKYPQHRFALIMGSDNLHSIEKWKHYELLLRDYEIYVYRRGTTVETRFAAYPNIHILQVPLLDISSSMIRGLLRNQQSTRYLLPEPVREYVEANHLYAR